jgi:methyltransferase, FkbM family
MNLCVSGIDIRERETEMRSNHVENTYVQHVGWFQHEPGDEVAMLLREGHFEAEEQAFIWLYLRPGDTFIDGGAHFGLYSVLSHRATGGKTKVISVEPDPVTIKLLRANLEANNVTNVKVYEVALWNESDQLKFKREWAGRSSHNFVEEGAEATGLIEVSARKLDNLTEGNGEIIISFVKIDTEGSELNVLSGAEKMIEAGRLPLLMIEFTEKNLQRSGRTTKDLFEKLMSLGYTVCDFDCKALQIKPISYAGEIWYKNLFATSMVESVNCRLLNASLEKNESRWTF